jgi:hypothetical protein
MNIDVLPINCWLEGEIHGNKITKGQRLISHKGNIVGTFNRDLTEEETKLGLNGLGPANPNYLTLRD